MKKKRAKARAKRAAVKARQNRPLRTLSRVVGFISRHRVAALIGGALALLGSLASIYSIYEPRLVAASQRNTFSGQLQAEPGGGLAVWVEGEQPFKNVSWKGGGRVAALQMIPNSPAEAAWFANKVVHIKSETFAARENKVVKYNALFPFPELAPGKNYPKFVAEFQFLDQAGAVVNDDKGKPYSLKLNIDESVLNSLKAISNLRSGP